MGEELKVYGPPGTGKSTYIQNRVKQFRKDGYKKNEILVVTYRKDTALKLGIDIPGARVTTMHSACLKALGASGTDVISPDDELQFSKDTGYPMGKSDETTGSFMGAYDWARHTRTHLNDISNYPMYDDMANVDIIDAVQKYEDWKLEKNKVDYTDMISKVREDGIIPEIKILMCDETQDNTKLIHETLRMWADEMEHVIIAGDPMQTIYTFLGCDPCFFNGWDAPELVLDYSRRLKTPVWELSRAILSKHGQTVPDIGTRDADVSDCISYMHFSDSIPACEGTQMHLVRCNFQGKRIASEFQIRGIPFVSSNGMGGWSMRDLHIYNAIVKLRQDKALTKVEKNELRRAFPNDVLDDVTGKQPITPRLTNIIRTVAPISYSKELSSKSTKIDTVLRSFGQLLTMGTLQKIKVLTIHGAKGGQADNVFLHTGITRKIENAMDDEQGAMAEDRVFYTGASRTKEHLYIVEDADRAYYDIPYVGA